jgi:imidazole glycerol-phosphate synthase subunit HisF
MTSKRILPFLLLHNELLYKSVNFKTFNYIGDPLVAVKIFNEKEAEEICIIDADASRGKKQISFDLLADIASECFMPLSYGGGIKSMDEIQRLNQIGFEKAIINSSFFKDKKLVEEAVKNFGSSTIIGGIDYKNINGKQVCFYNGGQENSGKDLISVIQELNDIGVGEILLNSIDLDGTKKGIDTTVLEQIQPHLKAPLIYSGGTSSLEDIKYAFKKGADAVAAGSLFVYLGSLNAVLINYPDRSIIQSMTNL